MVLVITPWGQASGLFGYKSCGLGGGSQHPRTCEKMTFSAQAHTHTMLELLPQVAVCVLAASRNSTGFVGPARAPEALCRYPVLSPIRSSAGRMYPHYIVAERPPSESGCVSWGLGLIQNLEFESLMDAWTLLSTPCLRISHYIPIMYLTFE